MNTNPGSSDWWEEEIIKNTVKWYHKIPFIGYIYGIYTSYYSEFYNEAIGLVDKMHKSGEIDDKTQKYMKQVLFVNMEQREKYNDYSLAKDRLHKCCLKLSSIYQNQN